MEEKLFWQSLLVDLTDLFISISTMLMQYKTIIFFKAYFFDVKVHM